MKKNKNLSTYKNEPKRNSSNVELKTVVCNLCGETVNRNEVIKHYAEVHTGLRYRRIVNPTPDGLIYPINTTPSTRETTHNAAKYMVSSTSNKKPTNHSKDPRDHNTDLPTCPHGIPSILDCKYCEIDISKPDP